MKGILSLAVAAVLMASPAFVAQGAVTAVSSLAPVDGNVVEVVFSTNMRCKSCVKKINENLSFMKGVKGLAVSLEDQTITIKYDKRKTDEKTLAEAVRKLGYKAEKVEK